MRERDEGCEETDSVDLPNTGLSTIEKPEGKKRGAGLCQRTCHVSASSMTRRRPEDLSVLQPPMHRMGELVTEQLHIDVKAKVLQNARFKYACRTLRPHRDHHAHRHAAMLAQPIPPASPRLDTAFALFHEDVDGTPLYRLAHAFARAVFPVSVAHWATG